MYHAGSLFSSLYVIRVGAVKTVMSSLDGKEQVLGLHLPGDVLGLDAISDGQHRGAAVALDTTTVCEIPFARFERLAARIPSLQRHLLYLMSRQILYKDEALLTISKRRAEQRVAIMLLSLSRHFSQRALSPLHFRLPLSRVELGNFLGLAPETMSRVFRRLEEQGVLRTQGKEVALVRVEALRQLAHAENDTSGDAAALLHGLQTPRSGNSPWEVP